MNSGNPDISVTWGGLTFKNPLLLASGTCGYGPEYSDLINLNRLGGIVTKGISLEAWAGNQPPRTAEVPGGLLNAIGLQNPGVEEFSRRYLPFLRDLDTVVIVNIWGTTIEEYAAVAERLSRESGIDALEVNVSCPNIRQGGHLFGTDPAVLQQLVAAVRASSELPLIVKLPPQVPRIKPYIEAAAGAQAVSLINTMPAMAIDVETRRPLLGNLIGGLSGPAIHPVAVKLVYDAARTGLMPVIGMGGVTCARDALEMMIAGACMVAVGTATFTSPDTAVRIIDDLRCYAQKHGIERLTDICGSCLDSSHP